jgi:hypothetical protein
MPTRWGACRLQAAAWLGRSAVRIAAVLVCLLAAAAPVRAAIDLDLSHVDLASSDWLRFRNWVDGGGSDVTATDAIYVYRLIADSDALALAIARVDAQVLAAEQEIAAGRRPAVSYDSYLHVGAMIRDLALTLDWAGSAIDSWPGMANRRARWSAYAAQAVWNVWHPSQASWGGRAFPWSGWSVDNPGNNYHFSFLEASMAWALAANDSALASFIDDTKLEPALLDYYAALAGGGSREGTGYGTAHMNLFWVYRLWRDGHGYDWGRALPHVRDTIDYWIHATVPSFDRFAPIGDQSRVSYPELYDYHRRLVLEARQLAAGTPQAARASWWLDRISVGQMTSGFNLRHGLLPAGDPASATAPARRWHHATGVGHLFARTGWDGDALWLAMVAGPYEESHAHQDQGAITLFQGDEFLAVSENVWTHSGIQQGTEVHNLVRFEDQAGTIVRQRYGEAAMTVAETAEGLAIAADLRAVYASSPTVAGWTREVAFSWNGRLTVDDRFELAPGGRAVWQLNLPVMPVIAGREATAGALRVRVLEPADAVLTAFDWRTVDAQEFRRGWRLEVRGSGDRFLVELVGAPLPVIHEDDFEAAGTLAWDEPTR